MSGLLTTRRPPSIRTVAAALSMLFAVLAVLVVAVLVWSGRQIDVATATVVRDTQSRALASELELSLLVYQRVSNAYALTDEESLSVTRSDLAVEMQRLLREAANLAWTAEERRRLVDVAAGLSTYLEERRRLEALGSNLEDLFSLSQPSLNAAIESLESLGELNDVQVREGHSRVLEVTRLAITLASLVGGAIVLGLLGAAHCLRRYVLRPMLALHGTISLLRSGNRGARAARSGAREVQELAEGLNEMADTLGRQREDQLTFLAGVAHELRNPLHALKLGMQGLAEEVSPMQRRRLHTTLDNQLNRLSRMVEDLLDATRIEAGKLEIRPETLDLRDTADTMVRLYAPTSRNHPICSKRAQQPVLVEGDPLRLEQVVGNLISNAIKFSPRGGPITVEVRADGARALLSVSDRGVGIPADELADVFLPFRRRNLAVAPGAGLGLSVVRRIVEGHGGDISVENRSGGGCRFQVRLPLVGETPKALPVSGDRSGLLNHARSSAEQDDV